MACTISSHCNFYAPTFFTCVVHLYILAWLLIEATRAPINNDLTTLKMMTNSLLQHVVNLRFHILQEERLNINPQWNEQNSMLLIIVHYNPFKCD